MSAMHLPTRRTLLALGLGAAGTLALSACAPTIRNETEPRTVYPSPTQSFGIGSQYDYDGIIRLDNYEKHGKYVPATTEHPAQNVPKPLMPDYINEYSNDGMYAFIAYWVESINYAYLTGDSVPLGKVADAPLTLNPDIMKLYESKTGWVIGPKIYSVEFETAGSHDNLQDPSVRERQSVIRKSPEAKVYNSATGVTTTFLEFAHKTPEVKAMIGIRYLDQEWYFVQEDGSNVEKKPL